MAATADLTKSVTSLMKKPRIQDEYGVLLTNVTSLEQVDRGSTLVVKF